VTLDQDRNGLDTRVSELTEWVQAYHRESESRTVADGTAAPTRLPFSPPPSFAGADRLRNAESIEQESPDECDEAVQR
jgi:hypothetical protein